MQTKAVLPMKCLHCQTNAAVIAHLRYGSTLAGNKYQPLCQDHLMDLVSVKGMAYVDIVEDYTKPNQTPTPDSIKNQLGVMSCIKYGKYILRPIQLINVDEELGLTKYTPFLNEGEEVVHVTGSIIPYIVDANT